MVVDTKNRGMSRVFSGSLQQQPDAGRLEARCGVLEILDQGGARFLRVQIRRLNTREAIDARTTNNAGVLNRPPDPVLEFGPPIWQACDTTLPVRPVAGRHVVQNRCQPVGGEFLFEHERIVCVGKLILDGLEARGGGCTEAVEKIQFVEQQRQIRSESGHVPAPFRTGFLRTIQSENDVRGS
jgi:hypothetical protein